MLDEYYQDLINFQLSTIKERDEKAKEELKKNP
jgi:hypothetical protein